MLSEKAEEIDLDMEDESSDEQSNTHSNEITGTDSDSYGLKQMQSPNAVQTKKEFEIGKVLGDMLSLPLTS